MALPCARACASRSERCLSISSAVWMPSKVSVALAKGAPERPALTFDGLRTLIRDTTTALNGMGIGRGDRVAIVLPNGPEMAAAFLTIAAAATTAPLNPAYRAEEFEFYLSDLDAKALVLDAAGNAAAEEVANRLKIPVVRLEVPAGAPAGSFRLDAATHGTAANSGPAAPGGRRPARDAYAPRSRAAASRSSTLRTFPETVIGKESTTRR